MPQGLRPSVTSDSPRVASNWLRLGAALMCAACVTVLVVARRLEPAAEGYGTHTQLGSGPCGMLIMTGYPCPSCGMTTAFAHAVRGELVRAFVAQPAGLALALATGVGAVLSGWVLITGSWPRLGAAGPGPFVLFLSLLVLLVGAWTFKICYGLVRGELPYR